MQMKPLKELLQDLEQEMLRLGYTDGSMKFYHNRWKMLKEFAEEKDELYYSEKLGIEFIEKKQSDYVQKIVLDPKIVIRDSCGNKLRKNIN